MPAVQAKPAGCQLNELMGTYVMQASNVPVKTATGQREIGQRALKLTPRVRSLLIMVHGTDTVADLTRSLHSLGDVMAILNELAALGLITVIDSIGPSRATPHPEVTASDIAPPTQQVKQLFNESAVAALGVLGTFAAVRFTLKLEHCYSAEELRGIIPEYRRVVSKAKGAEFADTIVRRAETLLAAA
jgi:hypothetical protein